MSPLIKLSCLLVFVNCAYGASFHKFHSGECPQIDSMPGFNIDKFLGTWFVALNSNDNAVSCLQEEFSLTQDLGKEMIDMARNELENTPNESDNVVNKTYQLKRTYLPFGGRKFLIEIGKVQFVSNKSQSEMEIDLPYTETGMINMKHYQVIGTDYDNYALVWKCQRTIFGHRRTAQLLSRKPTMSAQIMEELNPMIKHFETENDLKFDNVRQENCQETTLEEEIDGSTGKPLETGETTEMKRPEDKNKKVKPHKPIVINKEKKKLINIDIGGFHLSISLPLW